MVSKRIARLASLFAVSIALIALVACGGSKSTKSTSTSSSSSSASAPAAQPTKTGPQASVDPKSVPPGNQIVVSGSGWPALSQVSIEAEDNPNNGKPYAQVTTDSSGAFTTHFRMEFTPDGTPLKTGRFWLLAKGANTTVEIPFQIDTARPVKNPGDGG